MPWGRKTERREAKHAGLTLEHSFLFRIPRPLAWVIMTVLPCAVAVIEYHSPRGIWFGPVYLAVLALTAWSLSSRIAIAIGLAILSAKLATGTLPFHRSGELALANVAVRVAGMLVIITFIGMARRSCEREWRFARTDALTGALNRQAFFEIVETDRARGRWSAMIYADLDGLKQLNDKQGHAKGDLSLKVFAETISNTIRGGDVFARMGGDEFVIFMKLKDAQSGEAVARRLHKAVNTRTADARPSLTCSMGVLLLPEGLQSIDAELRAADGLMYEAKKARSGTLVATLVEHGGKMVLSPPIAISGPPEHHSAVRKTDRKSHQTAVP